jgi:DNA topoisomerase-1
VWIAPDARAHIQATGFDAKGRLQYVYHAEFRAAQEQAKFSKLLGFAAALPRLREAVARDMRRTGAPRERALATLVHLLEHTLIRIGNAAYARDNASFGLTTLTSEHVEVAGATMTFDFVGKSGKAWKVTIRDRRAASVMRAFQDLPGQKLFQYLDEAGQSRAVSSGDVNAYLKQVAGRRVSAKDFRTWAGTLTCALALAREAPAASERALKRQIAQAMRETARALGNTPAVARASYVHPHVIEAHGTGALIRALAAAAKQEAREGALKPEEQAFVRLLRRAGRAQAASRAGRASAPRRSSPPTTAASASPTPASGTSPK